MSTPLPPTALYGIIVDLAHGREIDGARVTDAFDVVMRGDGSVIQVAALLTGLRVRGESAAVIAGVARSLRRAMIPLPTVAPDRLVDTCGTGGGAVSTFNISTAAALVAAGAGVMVAKHGNRSFTSRSGSADVLEALGVNIEVDPPAMRQALDTAGIVFMFAPRMHPAMRHVGPVRRELGVPTVMNVVGPLANPASAGRQVIGVADRSRLRAIAEALSILGTTHSLVVHGEPGLDEISPLGPTTVLELRGAETHEWTITPAEHGLAVGDAAALAGGSPEDNAALIEQIVGGAGPAEATAAVVLNAAAAIYVGGQAASYADGVARAKAALTNGSAAAALGRLRSALPR